MKEKDALLRKIVKELVSEEAIPIVEYLKGKTKISEFVISEELELEIHKTRFFLYKLLDHNLVSFIRKKDKIKGWYICYWDLNEDIVNHLDQKMKDDKIDKLQERLKREEDNQFYLCRNACARMDFDRAMEFTFKCPECGEIMHLQDNTKTIDFLKERIKEIDEEGGKKKKTA
jgi:transcription initiation factor TFIIE subunit alpha